MTKKKADSTPEPPKHLRKDTAAWWRDVVNSFELEEHHYRLLRLACESFDRCQEARETLAKVGTVYTDRFGSPKMRPEVLIERDAKVLFMKCLRELGLDLTPEDPRPPTMTGRATTGE